MCRAAGLCYPEIVRLILCSLFAVAAFAQNAPQGLEPTWDMAAIMDQLGKDTARLQPLLDQVNADGWAQKGASETYRAQLQSSKDQARAIVTEAAALTRNPEKLSGALQLYFRFEGLETMLGSLEEAARRYQDARIAQDLAQTFAISGANRERLRNYVVNLAADRERQFEIMDQEAQRCRGTLMTPPPKTTVRKK
jgi:hypothetical protein